MADPEAAEELAAAGKLIEKGETTAAFNVLSRVKARRRPALGTDYVRALCCLREKRPYDAIEALKEELRYFPEHREAKALLEQLRAGHPEPALPEDAEFRELYAAVRPYTMLSVQRLYSLFSLTREICRLDLPGQFVECGVAAGGASALIAAVAARHSRRARRVFSCDSFAGLPVPAEVDRHAGAGADAIGWGAGTCAAPAASLLEICRRLEVDKIVEPVPGFFADTLPTARERIGPIAFLHLDGDWYESTLTILEQLYPQVVPGGKLQVDDYGYWEGCRRAVEDFQAARGLRFELHRIDDTGVWLTKPS